MFCRARLGPRDEVDEEASPEVMDGVEGACCVDQVDR